MTKPGPAATTTKGQRWLYKLATGRGLLELTTRRFHRDRGRPSAEGAASRT